MDRLDKEAEAKLIQGIRKAVEYSNDGMLPDDAITKVATDLQLQPEHIKRATEAFNKSYSVSHMTKAASGDERARAFPIAHSDIIIKNVYGVKQEKVASSFNIPDNDFSKLGLNLQNAFEKTALDNSSKEEEAIPFNVLKSRSDKYAAVVDRFKRHLSNKHLVAKGDLRNAIDKVAEAVQPLSTQKFYEVAQMVCNGFPTLGIRMLKVAANDTRKPLPEGLQKTASAIVFPKGSPYDQFGNLFSATVKLGLCEATNREFIKEADAGTALFSEYIKARQKPGSSTKDRTDELLEVVDPSVLNNLRRIEAKKTLLELMMYDPDISKYNAPDVLGAYNQAVSGVENAYNKPNVLRNLMLQNLETGGVKDPFQLSQEAKLNQDLNTQSVYGGNELV